MCSLMGKSLAVFQKNCFSIHVFLLKMQKYAFLKKNDLSEFLYKIKVPLVINWSSQLQKNT